MARIMQETDSTSDRALDRLCYIANSTDFIGDKIEEFLDRCRGQESVSADSKSLSAVPAGHLGQLDRLQNSINRLEKLAYQLNEIG